MKYTQTTECNFSYYAMMEKKKKTEKVRLFLFPAVTILCKVDGYDRYIC